MQSDLIYDVGVNDGADTAYYLHKGFRVLGIEASPVACRDLEQRFAPEISRGAFTLLNVGIAGEEGEFPFWVCDDHPEWSSFHREIASRQGSRHHSVAVRTRKFSDIIAEHGVPYYCKIDIEGNDRTCISDLTPDLAPPYISIENSHGDGHVDLSALHDLGYTRFKIISQQTFAQPNRLASRFASWLPARRYQFFRAEQRVRGVVSLHGWTFPGGSSGPFAEDTSGSWRSYEDTLSIWRFVSQLNDITKADGQAVDWHDIHAAR